jgi:hypothetical protein
VRRSTAGEFKIALLDQCSVVQLPAEIHTELKKMRLDIVAVLCLIPALFAYSRP